MLRASSEVLTVTAGLSKTTVETVIGSRGYVASRIRMKRGGQLYERSVRQF